MVVRELARFLCMCRISGFTNICGNCRWWRSRLTTHIFPVYVCFLIDMKKSCIQTSFKIIKIKGASFFLPTVNQHVKQPHHNNGHPGSVGSLTGVRAVHDDDDNDDDHHGVAR